MLRRCNPLLRATPTCAVLSECLRNRRKPDVACLGRNPLLALGAVGRPGVFRIWDFGLRVVSGSAELTVEALSRTIANLRSGFRI